MASDSMERIYVSEGVFAEIVLQVRDERWMPLPGTSRDHRSAADGFFREARLRYLEQLAGD